MIGYRIARCIKSQKLSRNMSDDELNTHFKSRGDNQKDVTHFLAVLILVPK